MADNGFYTLRGYNRRSTAEISAAMEDYLEMVCRLIRRGESVRVNGLAARLNVTPPSASKMVSRLREAGMIQIASYGIILPTDRGQELGDYLLRRHDVLHRFLCRLNSSDDELELVEKIEHYIDRRTIDNLEKLLASLWP